MTRPGSLSTPHMLTAGGAGKQSRNLPTCRISCERDDRRRAAVCCLSCARSAGTSWPRPRPLPLLSAPLFPQFPGTDSACGTDVASRGGSDEDGVQHCIMNRRNFTFLLTVCPMLAQLIPASGGPPITLQKPITVVGRSAALCDLVINHTSISKMHCMLVKTDGLVYMRDLASTNGTRVNGQRVIRGALLPGDRLSFSGVTFKVHLGPDPPAGTVPGAASQDGATEALPGIAAAELKELGSSAPQSEMTAGGKPLRPRKLSDSDLLPAD